MIPLNEIRRVGVKEEERITDTLLRQRRLKEESMSGGCGVDIGE